MCAQVHVRARLCTLAVVRPSLTPSALSALLPSSCGGGPLLYPPGSHGLSEPMSMACALREAKGYVVSQRIVAVVVKLNPSASGGVYQLDGAGRTSTGS